LIQALKGRAKARQSLKILRARPGHQNKKEGWLMDSRAKAYASEPVRYPALHVVDLAAEAAEVTDSYRNIVVNQVNGSCLRLSVMTEDYRWHYHPKSDELFLVVDGCLQIDLADGRTLRLTPWQCVTVPAGAVHRTRPVGRSVNLCFEELAADTVFVDPGETPLR
jgi:mannose-6-phosphate isomerase-like protein (cupin superfamily)